MHRIKLTEQLGLDVQRIISNQNLSLEEITKRTKDTSAAYNQGQKVYAGVYEVYTDGEWVTDTEHQTRVIARWITYGKSVADVPSTKTVSTISTILQASTDWPDYVTPDVLDVFLTGVSSLVLLPTTFVSMVSMTTGSVVTPTSVEMTSSSTTLNFTNLTGYHRIFLAPKQTTAYVSTQLSNNALIMKGMWFIHGDLRNGNVTQTWSAISYNSGYTTITFTSPPASGMLLKSSAYSFNVEYRSEDLMLKLPCEYPVRVRGTLGVVTQPTISLLNGSTYLPLSELVSPLEILCSQWALKVINPEGMVSVKRTTSGSITSVTQNDILDAVRMMHTHSNLSALGHLDVVEGVLLVDGTPIDPVAIAALLDSIVAQIENFNPTAHTHLIGDVSGLTATLAAKASTTHTHTMSNVDGLSAALSAKASSTHTHEQSNVVGLVAALAALSSTLSSHSHVISGVAGLQTALNNKLQSITVTILPASPVTNTCYLLTNDDPVAQAAGGFYVWTGVAWLCIVQFYAYDLGEITGVVTLPNIVNVEYTAKVITGATRIDLPRFVNPGNIVLRLQDGGSFVVTWSSNVEWTETALPVLSVDNADWLVFASSDGYEWHGASQLRDIPLNTREMTSVWTTPAINTSVTLPFVSTGTYNCIVDWGDGTVVAVKTWNAANATHIYAAAGAHTVTITGYASHWSFNNSGSKLLLTSVTNLGALGWQNLDGAFYGCTNLTAVSGGDVSNVTSMANIFRGCTAATLNVSTWDTANVTTVSGAFRESGTVDAIAAWDLSSCTDFSYMFYGNANIVPVVTGWNTAAATTIAHMFENAVVANPNVGTWDMSNVTDMSSAFRGAVSMTTAVPEAEFWGNDGVLTYAYCFLDATNISNYVDIPVEWK